MARIKLLFTICLYAVLTPFFTLFKDYMHPPPGGDADVRLQGIMKLNICSVAVTCFIFSSVMLYSPLAHPQAPAATPIMQSKAPGNIQLKKILSTGVAFNGSIIQDRDGFFWIATQAGLYKYNGNDIKKYDTTNSPMKGARIQTVFEDSVGHIWFTTQGTGAYRYDKKTDVFTVYLAEEDNVNSISGNAFNWSPYAIEEDNEGFVWIGSTNGLNRYDKTTDTFTRYKNKPGDAGTLSSDDVWSVMEDKSGSLWVGTSNGLNKYDKNTETFTTYKDNDYKATAIYALYEDSQGTLWLGTNDIGLASFDTTAGKFIYHSQPSKAFKMVTSISEYGDSLLLSHGLGKDGLSSFNRKTRELNTYTTKSKAFGLKDDATMHTLIDKLGRLWVVTFSAIHIYDPSASQFEYFSAPSNNPENPIKNVLNMIEDKNGDIWLGTFGYGVFRYRPETDTITQYLSDKDVPYSLPNNATPGLLIDSNDDLWVGGEGFLAHVDLEAGTVKKKIETPKFALLHLLEDKQDHDIFWGSLFKGGLLRINKLTGEYKLYTNDPSDSGSLGSNFFLHMHQEDNGTLWIATSGGGLQQFDREREIFTSYTYNPEIPGSIGNNTVNGITVSSDERTWWLASEAGGGLIKFDRKTIIFKNFNTQNGFPTDNTAHVIEDNDGGLWIATSDIAILRYTPDTRKYIIYGEDKGVMPGQFWASSGLKANDGAIYFGGLNGFNKFYPDRIRQSTIVPPVYFTSLTQGGKPIALNSALELTQHIQLDWKNNFFEFEYAALNYPASQSVEYMYRLEGWDPPDLWYKAGPRRSGRYSGLKSGTYNLHVKGTNNDGVWNNEGASIEIIIQPPWWETFWFRVFSTGLLFFLIYSVIKYVQRLRLEIIERENAEEALRESEFFFSQLFEQSMISMGLYDSEGTIIRVNDEFCRMFGVSEKVILNAGYNLFKDEAIAAAGVVPLIESVFEEKLSKSWEINFDIDTASKSTKTPTTKSGNLFLEVYAYPVINVDSDLEYVVLQQYDITERKQTEQRIKKYQQELELRIEERTSKIRSLSSELLLTEERERRQIAENLHDNIGQKLAFTKMKLNELKTSNLPLNQASSVNNLYSLIDQMIQETRSLTFDLSAPILYELGLEPALDWLIESLQGKHDIVFEFDTGERIEEMNDSMRVLLYRVTRELIFNIFKHSQAQKAKISILKIDNDIQIVVEDNGIGFNSFEIDRDSYKNKQFGLFSIKERMVHMGGHFEIKSKPGQGSRFTLAVPSKLES
ncbi:two-component regulator propeller domain-containing protein [Desulfobacterales bacterium HSG17]|nr:two-component regulator propeller domain-containing protein [Desulfobacterales bacterium HSG17]